MKILAISAHPDDIEIFMYGFLMSCINLDYEVKMIVATDGALGGKNIDGKLSALRKKESKLGLRELGNPFFLNLPDGNLGYDNKHLIVLKNSIDKYQPDLIVTHHEHDYHSDHVQLSKMVKIISSHYIPILYCDTMMGVQFNPTYYIDITKYFSNKINAILCHKTQNPERFVSLAKSAHLITQPIEITVYSI